jgi:hypothetical protein
MHRQGQGQGIPQAFVFDRWGGSNEKNSHESVTESLYNSGFALVHNDDEQKVFAPQGTEYAVDCLPLPTRRLVRRMRHRLRKIQHRLLGQRNLPLNHAYEPHFYTSPRNTLSKAIVLGRQSQSLDRTIGVEEIKRFYIELVGDEGYINPDEQFYKFIDGTSLNSF